jgi:hypothetical protein
MDNINVSIPVELTQSMIVRRGVVESEALALELAHELHDVIARATKLFLAETITVVRRPVGPDGKEVLDDEPVMIDGPRAPTELEVADFVLALWRVAVDNGADGNPSADTCDAAWVSEKLAALSLNDDPDEMVFENWYRIGSVVTGESDAGMPKDMPEGGAQAPLLTSIAVDCATGVSSAM